MFKLGVEDFIRRRREEIDGNRSISIGEEIENFSMREGRIKGLVLERNFSIL
jgi:hypothetical protein